MSSIEKRLAALEEMSEYNDGSARKRASALLLIGSIFGLLGFFFAFVTGVLKVHAGLLENKFPSGRGYFPPSVSEMVHDPTDPAGKAFFAFEFIGASFIFLSNYPWKLRNVYFGDDDIACFGVSWPMMRQFIPATGMMLVATVTTTPIYEANIRTYFTIAIHGTGAMMMFVGYMIIEGKALGMFGMSKPSHVVHMKPAEEKFRKFFIFGTAFFFGVFIALQIILALPPLIPALFPVTDTLHPDIIVDQKLVDTATGFYALLKVFSYSAEVILGWALIMSHATIWYFCDERLIDLADELVSVEMAGGETQEYKKMRG